MLGLPVDIHACFSLSALPRSFLFLEDFGTAYTGPPRDPSGALIILPGRPAGRRGRDLLQSLFSDQWFHNTKVKKPVNKLKMPEDVLPHFRGAKHQDAAPGSIMPFVFGGQLTDPKRYTYVVSLRRPAGGSHFCGGSLIRPDVVLTAAHCVDPRLPNGGEPNPILHIGRHCRACTQEDFEVVETKESVRHPNWTGNILDGHDVAVILLNRSVFSVSVASVVTRDASELEAGDQLKVAGWGFIDSTSALSTALMTGDVPYVDNEQCNRLYRELIPRDVVKGQMMCAGSSSVDACRGDSGGPLFLPSPDGDPSGDVIVGVVSFGAGCGINTTPTVYSRLTELLDFLAPFLPKPVVVVTQAPVPAPTLAPTPAPTMAPPPTTPAPTLRPRIVSPAPQSGCHDEFQVRWLFGVCPYGIFTWRQTGEPKFVALLEELTGIEPSSVIVGSSWGWASLSNCGCRLHTQVFAVLKTYNEKEADALAAFVARSTNVLEPLNGQEASVDCAAGRKVTVRAARICF